MAAVAEIRLRARDGASTCSSTPTGSGLDAYGVSFHVGSQQPNPKAWDMALKSAAAVFRTLSERGIQLRMVNLGGGFPAKYLKKCRR